MEKSKQQRHNYSINHVTDYQYEFPVSLSHHAAYLKPADTEVQQCHSHFLTISPTPEQMDSKNDFYGNHCHIFSIETAHNTLSVESTSQVSVINRRIPNATDSMNCGALIDFMDSGECPIDIHQFVFPSESINHSPNVQTFANTYFRPGYNYLLACCRLAMDIFEEFEFDPTATTTSTPIETVLEQKKGVCQDFAHLMIACIRSCNLPARYVSGYILTHPPEGQPRLVGADATHAWVSIFLPHFGWVDIDPTNAQMCDTDYITVATGRDFRDVSPIKGSVTGGGEHQISVAVTVQPDSPKTPSKIPLITER